MTDKTYGSDPTIKLEKILGITTQSNASIASTTRSSDLFYAAGSVVVRYNPAQNSQKSFYKASKAISCLTVSVDGQYLAVGERGHSPSIIIWEISSGKMLATIVGTHKHGIGCLVFSPDSRYLISAGFKHDRQLIIWEWENLRKVSVMKLGNKVNSLCFHPSGSYFVSCGDRHLKWWYLTYEIGGVEVTGKPASILESHKNAVFMDMKVGSGDIIYCTTSTGLLCAFNQTRFMDMWVQLESSASYSLSTATSSGHDLVIVGCTEGLIRIFSAKTLQYLATLPLPVPTVGYTEKYPACLALCTIESSSNRGSSSKYPKLAAVYADHSIFVWDIADIEQPSQYRSFSYHRSCVWDVQFITSSNSADALFPPGTFVTCSADNTIRIWSAEKNVQRNAGAHSKSVSSPKGLYGEMLHLIEVSPAEKVDAPIETAPLHSNNRMRQSDFSVAGTVASSMADTIADVTTDPNSPSLDLGTGIPDLELPYRPQVPLAPRAMALHPSGKQLVCGDKQGLLRVYDLATMREVQGIQAHSAEVLSLHYSPPLRPVGDGLWTVDLADSGDEQQELVLLASAGRDRLVHVFNASKGYSPVRTLDNHSSSVTVVKFTPDGSKLLSCGGDRTMVFNSVRGTDISRVKSVQTPHGTINGLAIEATNKFAVTSGQDRRLNIWNLQSGKHVRAYKNDAVIGELYKSDVDPSGMFVAVCAFDKTINLFDFFSGDLVSQVSGHSELITAVRFSPDGRYLLSVGGDGCVMIWSMGERVVEAMQERALELFASAQKRQLKIIASRVDSPSLKGTPPKTSPLPPPPPSEAVGSAATAAAAIVTADGAKIDVRKAIAGSVGARLASDKGSRWASRVDPQGGYELFGRKMGKASGQNMKLTLEPKSIGRHNSGSSSDADEQRGNGQNQGQGNGLSPERVSSQLNDDSFEEEQYVGNKLANTLEASDDVMGFEGSDDDITEKEKEKEQESKKKSRGKSSSSSVSPIKGEEYEDDFDGEGEDEGGEAYLAKASSNIDTLEQSATNLENWLENMIRSGNNGSDNGRPYDGQKKKGDAKLSVGADQSSLLSNSLSSLFFKNLQLSKHTGKDKEGDSEAEREKGNNRDKEIDRRSENIMEIIDDPEDDLPPPPKYSKNKEKGIEKERVKEKEQENVSRVPVGRKGLEDLDASVLTMDSVAMPAVAPRPSSSSSSSFSSSGGSIDAMESRRKETAAAVAQMKSKLRNMGVLGATGEIGRKIEYRDRQRGNTPSVLSNLNIEVPESRAISDISAGPKSSTEHAIKNVILPSSYIDNAVSSQPSAPINSSDNVKSKDRSGSESESAMNSVVACESEIEEYGDGSDEEDNEDYGIIQDTIVFNNDPTSGIMSVQKRLRVDDDLWESNSVIPDTASINVGHSDIEVETETEEEEEEYSDIKSSVSAQKKSKINVESSARNGTVNRQGDVDEINGMVISDMDSDVIRNAQVQDLDDLYQQQEAKLRLKALQCKQIISELTRAKEAALNSFDELAELRASLDKTIATTYTHSQSRALAQSSVHDSILHVPTMDDTGISDFTGFCSRSVPQGMESTSNILQGSIVIAEADALISEFRTSFMSSSVPLTGHFFSSSSAVGQMGRDGGDRVGSENKPESSENENDLCSDLDIESTLNTGIATLPSVKLALNDFKNRDEQNVFSGTASKSLGPRQDDSADDIEMFAFLEKYSDRLVDMVSDKVMEKTMAKERSLRSLLDSR